MSSKQQEIAAWIEDNKLTDTFHSFIKRQDGFKRLAVGLCGWSWEDEFALLAKEMGFEIKPAESKTLPYDLWVNDVRVQCKFECCNSLPELHSVDIRRRHERRYEVDAFDLMAIKLVSCSTKNSYYYFIPAQKMLDKGTNLKARINIKNFSESQDDWMAICETPHAFLA